MTNTPTHSDDGKKQQDQRTISPPPLPPRHPPQSQSQAKQPLQRPPSYNAVDVTRIAHAGDNGQGEGGGHAVAAAATAEDDGTIGVEIDVRDKAKFRQSISGLGLRKGARKWNWGRGTGDKEHPDRLDAGDDVEQSEDADSDIQALSPKSGATLGGQEDRVPPMSIVIFIVGSRGDVQPYIALALSLILTSGHRVRLATHPDFRSFVRSANSRLKGKTHNSVNLEGRLEFFDAGGDPKELMAYMVKNPGLMPGLESLTNGDIKRKRMMAAQYLRGFYLSTFMPDIVSGREFAADAIISNPPAFAHIHIAQALGIPLHMSFTMPWTATTAFPHPLVNVKKSNADQWATNWLGYHLADTLIWEGLGDIINDFRTSVLRLEEIPSRTAAGVLDNLRVPWTYCWSSELLPKPKEWRKNIDISGFYFLDGEEDFVPPPDLAAFLAEGEAPVYVGFGSVVIPDPGAVTDVIFEAVKNAGVRAVVSAGWAGLGKGREESDRNIFILNQDCSHEWLFANDRVAAVCHHGGAGTTSCGLRHGRPTIIVPFFGDQKFWGDAVHNAGAGPAPIPIKTLTVDMLSAALTHAISPEAVAAAGVLGEKIRAEDGAERGRASFERNLRLRDLCCDVDSSKVAVWWCPSLALKLSVDATAAAISARKISFEDLEPYRSKEYDVTLHTDDPLSAVGLSVNNLVKTSLLSFGQLFYKPGRGAINTVYGIPEAMAGVVGDLYDGFDNMPSKMGSTLRAKSKVTDWKSGFKEGGKALGWGVWDGVTGIFTEPVDGALREGAVGFGKGVGRGLGNAFNRPTAGMLALFVLPTRGIRASVRTALGQQLDPHSVLRGPREALTRQAMIDLSGEDRMRLMDTFIRLEGETKARQGEGEKKTSWMLIADKRAREDERARRARESADGRERREVIRAADQVRRESAGSLEE